VDRLRRVRRRPVWLAQSEEKLDRRGFAGTVPAEERDDLALVDPEADV
jgi:hypothetical protein